MAKAAYWTITDAEARKRGEMCIRDRCDESLHGTKVHFLPDPEIFEETVYDYDTL